MKAINHKRAGRLSVFAFLAGVTSCAVRESDQDSPGSEARPLGARASERSFNDEVSYTHDIRPIVRNFCTTCHAGADPEGGFVLTSYEAVRKYTEKGELLARINDAEDPMPQSGLLPMHIRRLFRVWADTGYKNKGKRLRGTNMNLEKFVLPSINSVDLDKQGFEFLAKMQGHWVGSLWLMGQDLPWFAFDYRAIAPSHVHGIFEGGTIGNLFTSFFLARDRGKKVIMARNGGILNGIYRTSYFVLDEVQNDDGRSSYRFVDAFGGAGIMWMRIVFEGETIGFSSYTSRLGLTAPPKLHMRFKGRRQRTALARQAAEAVGFSQRRIELDLPKGLPKPKWGDGMPITSASYIWEDSNLNLIQLGKRAGDPLRLDQIPYVSKLTVNVKRNRAIQGKKLLIYLSRDSLTNERGKLHTELGHLRADLANGILTFPELAASQSRFTFTYLHPGTYFLTVVADIDGDLYPSPGDLTHSSRCLVVRPEAHQEVYVKSLDALVK